MIVNVTHDTFNAAPLFLPFKLTLVFNVAQRH